MAQHDIDIEVPMPIWLKRWLLSKFSTDFVPLDPSHVYGSHLLGLLTNVPPRKKDRMKKSGHYTIFRCNWRSTHFRGRFLTENRAKIFRTALRAEYHRELIKFFKHRHDYGDSRRDIMEQWYAQIGLTESEYPLDSAMRYLYRLPLYKKWVESEQSVANASILALYNYCQLSEGNLLDKVARFRTEYPEIIFKNSNPELVERLRAVRKRYKTRNKRASKVFDTDMSHCANGKGEMSPAPAN